MSYEGKLVYICEDDRDLQELLKIITQELNFTTVAHDNGKDCLHSIIDKSPDLIISDINMPEMNGIELLKKLHQMNAQIPVIFLTGDSSPQFFRNAIAYNHFEFLMKPLDHHRLSESIDKAMNFGFQQQSLEKTVDKLKTRL